MNAKQNLTGKRFGKLLVVRETLTVNSPHSKWYCKCDCGNFSVVFGFNLKKGQTKSCGCMSGGKKKPYEAVYNRLCRVAKLKHLPVLGYTQFLLFVLIDECHYCGAKVQWSEHVRTKNKRQSSTSYNLDRKDNSKGYTAGNCVVCCARCNWAKGNLFTYAEFVEIGKTIRRLQCSV